MEINHLMPLFSNEYKGEILRMMLRKNCNLYVDFSTSPCEFASDFVSPPEKLYSRQKISASLFKVSSLIDLKEDGSDKVFNGHFFYNVKELLIGNFSGESDISLYSMGLYNKKEGGEMVFMIAFPQAFPLSSVKYKTREGKLLFSFPPKVLFSHFGTGNFVPTLERMMKVNDLIKVPGCPYEDPTKCSSHKKHEKCGFNQKDNICRLVVSMSAVSNCSPSASIC